MADTIQLTSTSSITRNAGNLGLNNTNPQFTWDVSGSGNYSAGLQVNGALVLTTLSYVAGTTGFTNGFGVVNFHNGVMPTGAFGSGLYSVDLSYNFSSGNFVPPTGYNLGASGKTATGFYFFAIGHPSASNVYVDYLAIANNN